MSPSSRRVAGRGPRALSVLALTLLWACPSAVVEPVDGGHDAGASDGAVGDRDASADASPDAAATPDAASPDGSVARCEPSALVVPEPGGALTNPVLVAVGDRAGLAYNRAGGRPYKVFAQLHTAGSWQDPLELGGSNGLVTPEDVALTASGHLGVVAANANGAAARIVGPDGLSMGAPLAVPAQGFAALGAQAATADGLEWAYADGQRLLLARASTTAWSAPMEIGTSPHRVLGLSFALDPSGDGALVWFDSHEVSAQAFVSGAPVGAIATLSFGAPTVGALRAVALPGGGVEVVAVVTDVGFHSIRLDYDEAGGRLIASGPSPISPEGSDRFDLLATGDRLVLLWYANTHAYARWRTDAGWQPIQDLGAAWGLGVPPRLASAPDGRVLALVQLGSSGAPVVLFEAGAGAREFGAPIEVTAEATNRPTFAMRGNGEAWVAWMKGNELHVSRCR